MSPRHVLFALLALAAARDASALITHCVGTSAELRAAITFPSANDDTEVRVRSGTYLTGGSRFQAGLRANRTVTVSGGWSANCTVQVRDPAVTTLEAEGLSQVLDVGTFDDVTSARLTISNLSIEGGQVTQGLAGGMVLRLNHGTPTVLLDRLRIRANHNTGGSGGGLRILNFTAATVVLRNSLVTFNSAQDAGGVSLSSTVAGAVTQLVNNTIVGNQASFDSFTAGGVVAAYTSPAAGSIELRNNVVHGNTSAGAPRDAYAISTGPGFVGTNNVYAVASGGKVVETGTRVLADPGFSGLGDFRPRSDSPLIDTGAALGADDAASRDYAYQPRVRGAGPDVGAFETDYAVFGDSFE